MTSTTLAQAGQDAARFAADLIRIDTTNRGGGDARERPAAEYVAARLAEAGLEPVLLESAPGRANVVARVAGAGVGSGSDGTGSDGTGSDGTGSDGTGSDGTGSDGTGSDGTGALLLHGHLDVVPA
ncbi:MAG: hypothetical protein M3Z75_31835, partial [Actinomycetota bacterium]|nr:hypothetical protein [Actinomycetota bacterium]